MKHFFTIASILLFFIFIPIGTVHAAIPDMCSTIDSSNYSACCTGINPVGDTTSCSSYVSTGAAGQIGGITGGSLSTAAVNGGAATASTPGQSSVASASSVQTCSPGKFNTLLDIAIWIKCIIGVIIIPGIFSLAFVVFLWGVLKFIRSSEKTDKEDGKRFIYMGLIGLFVMVSVWGIIKIVATTLGINSTVPMLQTDYPNPNKASATPTSITTGVTN